MRKDLTEELSIEDYKLDLENRLRNTFTDHAGRSSDNTLCKCYVLIYITVF